MNTFSLLLKEKEDRVQLYKNFSYELVRTKRSVKLIENFLNNEIEIGRVYTWKAMLLSQIDDFYCKSDERERGYRLYLAIKLLNNMKKSDKIYSFIRSMKELSLEEAIFWVWQYNIYNNKAIDAFKIIHMKR
ncbi:hypothetical protein JW865_06600 [Candidatus Bathyarchaeota archaeon]|nr:hypothetical protein [Candidatus Bathyarchaeota archaeon]